MRPDRELRYMLNPHIKKAPGLLRGLFKYASLATRD